MRFFDLKGLRSDLRADSGDDGRAWPYILGTLGLMALGEMLSTFQPPRSTEPVERIASAAAFALTLGGLVYTFRCNGGSSGRHFINRSFALNWVLGCRILRWLLPVLLVAGLILSPQDVEILTRWAGIGWMPFSMWIYLRTGIELRQLASVDS